VLWPQPALGRQVAADLPDRDAHIPRAQRPIVLHLGSGRIVASDQLVNW
jgi:hypothetical protein